MNRIFHIVLLLAVMLFTCPCDMLAASVNATAEMVQSDMKTCHDEVIQKSMDDCCKVDAKLDGTSVKYVHKFNAQTASFFIPFPTRTKLQKPDALRGVAPPPSLMPYDLGDRLLT